jgi:hypothetical protein
VRHTIHPRDWAASTDLKDAYFHIPINAADRKYQRFGWRGRLFEFYVFPFGLSPCGFHDQVGWFILRMHLASRPCFP